RELVGLLTQAPLVLRRQLPVRREQRALRGREALAGVDLRGCFRDLQLLGLAGDEAEEGVAWHLEHVGPGVGALRRQPFDADLDVADRVARLVAERLDDVALREPQLLAPRPDEGADPLPEGGPFALCPALPGALIRSSGHRRPYSGPQAPK